MIPIAVPSPINFTQMLFEVSGYVKVRVTRVGS